MILNTTRARPPALGSGVTVATGTSAYTHINTTVNTYSIYINININSNSNTVMSDTELDDTKSEILDVCEDETMNEDEVKYSEYFW